MRWPGMALAVLAIGCGPSVATGDGDGDGGSSSTSSPTSATSSSTSTSTTVTSSSTTSTTTGADTSTSEASSSDDGGTFITNLDNGCVVEQCDVWGQDCGRGKCVPWSSKGDGMFGGCTDARCSPVDRDPRQAGEPCTSEGPWSGFDDCDLGSYCWNVDAATNEGVCVAQCMGSENNPICADASLSCFQLSGTSVTACVPACDPLAPMCPPAMTCAMSLGNDYAPLCISQSLGVPTGTGTDCTFQLGCGDGFACVADELVGNCATDSCCAPLCDLAAPACPADHPSCTEVPTTPDGIGACALAM